MVQSISGPIGKEKSDVVCDVNFPHSNTGVPETQINVRPDNLWLVCAQEHRPDYKGLTGEQTVTESAQKWKAFTRKLLFLISPSFPAGGVTLTTVPEKGKNFYEKGFYLRRGRKELVSICYDGKQQKGTFLIILTGQFCSLLDLQQWRLIYKLAVQFGCKMNRIDLAVDDYLGKVFDLLDIERRGKKEKGWFKPVYRPEGDEPKCWRKEGSDGSFSIYVGAEDSTLQVCAYQKGIESKNTQRGRDYPLWIRYEVKFKKKKVLLDLSMILPENWASAVAGTSVYLNSKMKVVGDKFTMANEKVLEDALDKAVNGLLSLNKQWGPMIYDLQSILGAEGLIDVVARGQMTGPLAELTAYDAPEILARFDSALGGGQRSSDACAESDADCSGLF